MGYYLVSQDISFFLFFKKVLSRNRIGLMSMLGVYVVLGVGICVAFLVLIAEILWNRREKKLLTKIRFVIGRLHQGLKDRIFKVLENLLL